jgi:outer membrane receptor for ferrienterochelin and colicins
MIAKRLNTFNIFLSFLTIAFINLYNNAFAQMSNSESEKIIITATKTENQIDGIAASVDVITSHDIKMMGASTLKNIIEKTPGLTMQYGRFPHPSSKSKSAISIRGMGANGTLLLIDGKRVSGETENPYEMDRIPADMIERIEIVKGPMSTLYGSDALGGVINIITKKPVEDELRIGLDFNSGMNDSGEGNQYNASINALGKKGKLGYSFYSDYNETEPWTKKETYTSKALNPVNNQPVANDDQHNLTGKTDTAYRDESEIFTTGLTLDYQISDSLSSQMGVNYFQEDRKGTYKGGSKKPRPGQAPPAVMVMNTPVKSVDDNNRLDYNGSIKYKFSDLVTSKIGAYRSEYEKRNETSAINFNAPPNKKFSADVDITGFEAESIWSVTESHLLAGGAEYREISRNSSVLNPDPTSCEFVRDTQRFKALYLQDEWKLTKDTNAVFGIRYDDISSADQEITLKAGLVKQFSPMLRARINYAEGYRAPDAAELYITSPTPGDVPTIGAESVYGQKTEIHELDPEFLKSYEIGFGGNGKKFNYEIAFFFNDIKDKIELERIDINNDGIDDYKTYVNKTEAETKGIELNLGYSFDCGLSAQINWSELDTKDKSTNKDLLFNPDRTAMLSINYKLMQTLSLSLIARHIGEQYKASHEKTNSFQLVDISFLKEFGTNNKYELYGGINNIFDESVDEALGSNLGPYIFAGIRANF